MIGLNLPAEPDLEDALVELSRHVPAGVHIGKPSVGQRHDDGTVQFATTGGWWFLEPGGTAARMVELNGGRAEVTRWRDGVEIDRVIDRVEDAG